MKVECAVLSEGNIIKYDQEGCLECSKLIKTLYRRSMKHKGPNLYYYCNLKRDKEEKEIHVQK